MGADIPSPYQTELDELDELELLLLLLTTARYCLISISTRYLPPRSGVTDQPLFLGQNTL